MWSAQKAYYYKKIIFKFFIKNVVPCQFFLVGPVHYAVQAVYSCLYCTSVLYYTALQPALSKLWSFYKIKCKLHFIFIWKIGFYRKIHSTFTTITIFCSYDKHFFIKFLNCKIQVKQYMCIYNRTNKMTFLCWKLKLL